VTQGNKNYLSGNVHTNEQLSNPEAMLIASEHASFSGCVVHKGVSVACISSLHSKTLYVSLVSLLMEEGLHGV
jgi:hypothetical protein